MSSKYKYIHLTEADTHNAVYAELRPIKALHKAKKAYVQLIDDCATVVYLQNEHTQELQALWVDIDYDSNIVHLLPYQKRTRKQSDPLYYFNVSYWGRDKLIDWLKSFDLQIYYASGVGTGFYMVDDYLVND